VSHPWKKKRNKKSEMILNLVLLFCVDFIEKNGTHGKTYLCWLCKGRTTTNQKQHCLSNRHQNLVQADKARWVENLRRAAAAVSNEETMELDQTTTQDNLIGETEQLTTD
jgi:hypothetical protein